MKKNLFILLACLLLAAGCSVFPTYNPLVGQWHVANVSFDSTLELRADGGCRSITYTLSGEIIAQRGTWESGNDAITLTFEDDIQFIADYAFNADRTVLTLVSPEGPVTMVLTRL